MKSHKYLSQLIKTVLTVLVIAFIYVQISQHWPTIKNYGWDFAPLRVIASLIVALIALLVFAWQWKIMIGAFGHRLSIGQAYRVMYLSNLGRYIPGKVAQLFGILYFAKEAGVPPERAGASFVLVQLFAIPASLLIYFIAAIFAPDLLDERFAMLSTNATMILLAIFIVIAAVLIIRPQIFFGLANKVLRKFNRPTLELQLDKKVASQLFLGYSFGWICYGLAFWLFLTGIVDTAEVGIIAAVGLYNAAYQIGYLALFAPGGLGPRELVMGFLLTPFFGPVAPAIAVMARLWTIVIDVAAAASAMLVGRTKQERDLVEKKQ